MKGREFRILTLLGIDTAFFFLEIIVGYAVHSLALVADSFHMLNDIFSLIVALWAVRVAKSRGVDSKYTYGWQRAEILGALINGVFLVALCMTIFLEAIQRFVEPQIITNPVLILIVGSAGLASNIVGLVLFHEHGHSHGGADDSGHSHSHGDSGSINDEENAHSHSHFQGSNSPATKNKNSSTYNTISNNEDGPVADILPEETINEQTSLLGNTSTSGSGSETVIGNNQYSSGPHTNHYHSRPKGVQKKQKSLNMHGVFLHVLGDALGNVGVIATALFIWKTDYSWKYYMDPVISLFITVIIFSSALPLCRKASSILLQAAPQSIDADEVKEDVASLPGVEDIHDLHIWILKEDLFIATLHVSVSLSEEEFMRLAQNINACLHGHGIHSTTIQPEFISGTPSSTQSRASSIGSNKGGQISQCIVGGKSSGGLKASRSSTNLN